MAHGNTVLSAAAVNPVPPLTHGRRMATGAARVLAADALVVPTGVLAAAFLTRTLGPELYGLFTIAASIVLWVETGATLLLSRTAVKFVAEADDWMTVAARLNRVQLAVSLAAAGVLIGVAPAIATWLHAPALTFLLRVMAVDIPIFALVALHRAFLIGRGAFDRVPLPTAARWLVRLALVFVLVGFGLSVTGAILATVGGSLAALVMIRAAIRPPLWGRAAASVQGLWGYAVPLFLGAMAIQAFNRLDLLMVKALVDTPGAAGYYGAAQNMAIGPGLIAAAFSPLLLGTLAALAREGRMDDVRSMVQQVFRLMFVLLPFIGILSPAAPDLAAIVYGPAFVQAGPAAGILFFAAAALFIVSVTTAVMIALGRPNVALGMAAPLVPIALAAHWIVVPRFGAAGAAAVTACLSWLAAAAGILVVSQQTRIHLPVAGWVRVLVVTVVVSGIAYAWHASTVWLVLAELAVMGALALAGLWAAGVITNADLALARSLVARPRFPPAPSPEEEF